MKQIKKPNLSKIMGAFIISLVAYILGFFLRGNSNFTIPIVILIGASLLYVTAKISRLYYNKCKNKSNIITAMGVLGMFYVFFVILGLALHSFYLVPFNDDIIRRDIISLIIAFILIGISYFSLKPNRGIKPIVIMTLILSMVVALISVKVFSANFGETYLNQESLYGANVQFQYKAKADLSPQCSPVKGKIAPSNVQKMQQLEKNITSQIISQKMISHTQFQNKLNTDVKLKNITDYANKIGYIPLENGTQEITYDNGIKAIIAPMQLKNKSLENKAVYIASFSQNDSSNFSFVAQIQSENGTPTITMFNDEGGVAVELINGAIIREWGHHSCSEWQCIGYCAYYWIFIGNLGYFCKAACKACYGLPGPWTCGPCIACLIVFAADCGANCISDNCYWYPCQKDCSDENYCESFVYYCDGDDRRKHRLCHDIECNTEIPGDAGSCVDETGSPSWQDDAFVETCTYGCNEATGNCQGVITCYGDGGCGDSGWVGSPSCSGGDVYQTWREYTCYNAGTEDSYCDYDDDSILKEECTSGDCSGGECVASESCEDPDYPWYCNGQCWNCSGGNNEWSTCCPDSGDPEWCCYDDGPYCNINNGECDICGGYYPFECDTSGYDCWHCDRGEACCAEEYGDRDPDSIWCCYTDIGAVCMADGSCCLPYNETCNNLDDDCDGTIDSFSEGCGVGACANGTKTCTAGSWGSCSTEGLSRSETCNNIDDDCDGSVDESLSQECGTDVGACVKGTQTCSSGNWSACGGSYIGPTDETCNGIDDNCNNITDEQNVCNNSIVINLKFPENNTLEYINSTPTFGFNITNINYTSFNCTLWLDNGIPVSYANDLIWVNTETSWNFTANKILSNDVYYWWINCSDGVNSNIGEKRIITVKVLDLYINIQTLKDNYVGNEAVNITDPPSEPQIKQQLPNHLITRETAWRVLKNDYLSRYIDYNFVYINDSLYSVEWQWNNEFVRDMLKNCITLEANNQKKCIKNISITNMIMKGESAGIKGWLPYIYQMNLSENCVGLDGEGSLNCRKNLAETYFDKLNFGIENFTRLFFPEEELIALKNDIEYLKDNPLPMEIIKGRVGIIGDVIPLNKDRGTFYIELNNGFWNSNGLVMKFGLNSVIYEFNNSKTTENLTFTSTGSKIRYLSLPANVTLTEATLDLKGYNYMKLNISSDTSCPGFNSYSGVVYAAQNFSYLAPIDILSFAIANGELLYNWTIRSGRDGSILRSQVNINTVGTGYFENFTVSPSFVGSVGEYYWIQVATNDTTLAHTRTSNCASELDNIVGQYSYKEEGGAWTERTDADLWFKTYYSSYPENITIETDNSVAYKYLSEFNNSVNNVDLNVTALQNCVNTCGYPSGDNCNCQINFTSTTPGILEYSDIHIEYADNESKIRNDGIENTSVYILMKIQYWNGTNWLDEAIIKNDSSPRTIQPGQNNQLKLDAIWNPNAWNTSTLTYGNGTYRAYVAATDENDNILQNYDGTYIVAVYNFSYTPIKNLTISSLTNITINNTHMVFLFVINNTGSTTLNNINWTLDAGDGSSLIASEDTFSLASGKTALVFIEYNYSTESTFTVNATANSGTLSSSKQLNISLGNVTNNLDVYDFSVYNVSSTHKLFQFMIRNIADNENLTDISWSLNSGLETIDSIQSYNLTPNNFSYVFIEYNYTQTGDFTPVASASSGSNEDSETLPAIDIPDIEASNLSLIYNDSTHAVFFFTISNMLSTSMNNVNWTFDTDDDNVITANQLFSLNQSKEGWVFIEYNYSSAGSYNVNATARNGSYSDSAYLGFTIT